MDVLKGVVSKSSSHISISGNVPVGGVSSPKTSHIKTFQVNNRAVIFKSSSPVNINDGDEIVVAGRMSGEGLKCYAYRNFSNGTYGDYKSNFMLIAGLILAIFGWKTLSIWAALPGICFMLMGFRVKQAKSLCMKESK